MSASEQPRSTAWGPWIVIGLGLAAATLIWTGTLRLPNWQSEAPRKSERSRDSRDDDALVFAGGIVEGLNRDLPLQFEIPGRLKAVHVRAGQSVRAGEPLAELDSQMLERLVHEAQLRVRIARAQRESVAVDASRDPRSSSRAMLASNPSAGEAPNAEVLADQEALADSALRREQLTLEKCVLRAPRDGVVLETFGQVGELVGPGAERPLVLFADAGPRQVRAFVEELDALNVAPGQPAIVLVSGRPERQYHGRIVECAPHVRPKIHRHLRPGERLDVRVRETLVRLEDGDDLLLGLPVEVYVKPEPR